MLAYKTNNSICLNLAMCVTRAIMTALTHWHSQSLSAWTMVLNVLISSLLLFQYWSFASCLVFLHVIVHFPFSLMYHCHHNEIVNDFSERWIKMDSIMIYGSHLILHFALCYNIPWQVSCLSFTTMVLFTVYTIDMLSKHTSTHDVIHTSTHHAWIFMIHYIPFIVHKQYNMMMYHFAGFLFIWVMFSSDLIGYITGYKHASNALMHCALIFNNYIAFRFHVDMT